MLFSLKPTSLMLDLYDASVKYFRTPLNGIFRPKLISNFIELKEHYRNKCVYICLKNKLTTYNYGRNTIKILSNMSMLYSRAKLVQLLSSFSVNIEDKLFKIECSAIENTSVN